jgi:Flp pilus assembly protein CpaB
VAVGVVAVGSLLLLGVRLGANRLDILDVIELRRDVKAGEMLSRTDLARMRVRRADRTGSFHRLADVEGRVAVADLVKGHQLSANDVGSKPVSVAAGRRAFAIEITERVVLAEGFRSGDRVDLLFAGPTPVIVESVTVAGTVADSSTLIVSLDQEETERWENWK